MLNSRQLHQQSLHVVAASIGAAASVLVGDCFGAINMMVLRGIYFRKQYMLNISDWQSFNMTQ